MTYAINIADLDRDDTLANFLIMPVAYNRTIVRAEPGAADGHALVLDCGDEQAQAIIEVIRIKWPRNLLRCYRRTRRGTWRKV